MTLYHLVFFFFFDKKKENVSCFNSWHYFFRISHSFFIYQNIKVIRVKKFTINKRIRNRRQATRQNAAM